MLLLLTVVLQVNINDVWSWSLDSIAGYTVRWAYHSLMSEMTVMPNAPSVSTHVIWRKDVSFKVSVFAWKLFRDRLPTYQHLENINLLLLFKAYFVSLYYKFHECCQSPFIVWGMVNCFLWFVFLARWNIDVIIFYFFDTPCAGWVVL